jgi:hypothetical protein
MPHPSELRRARQAAAVALAACMAVVANAADRQWQTGTWTEFSVQRQMMEFGPGVTPFDRGRRTSSMRAMADVGLYVIETAVLRLELKDVRPINKPGFDAIVGQPVTFALERNAVVVRGDDGLEYKLRVTKKTNKLRK